MRVGFFQYPVISKDRMANLEYIASKIKDESFDLLVLPELFTSGYYFASKDELLEFSEDFDNSPTIEFLTQLMKNKKGLISGTIPEIYKENIYNSNFLVGCDGLVGFSRKIHLPDYEKRFFTSGNTIEVFKCGKMNIGLITCFDCWFPQLTSKLRILGANIICHSSCFGGKSTPKVVPIRALENQLFIICCNRVGTEQFGDVMETYIGNSQIIDPDGNVLSKADSNEKLDFVSINIETSHQPVYGNFITKDFFSEHNKYSIEIKK